MMTYAQIWRNGPAFLAVLTIWGCKPNENPPSSSGAGGSGNASSSGTGAASGSGSGGASSGAGGGAGGSGGGSVNPVNEPLCLDLAQCPGSVSIAHCWGITNPPPAVYGSGYAQTTNQLCTSAAPETCQAIVEGGVTGSGPAGPCCATTPADPDCSGNFNGKWHSWIRDWWTQGWLPSIGVSKSNVRRFHVVYNRNGFWGGPHHNLDCEARSHLLGVLVSAYRQCDTHVVVTTHSNGGVTFLWTWRSFIDDMLNGAQSASLDQDRAATCAAKGRMLPNGDVPPLYVNAHLMQAAVGEGGIGGNSSDFFPIQPYESVGKKYWEPRDGAGKLRALPGLRFYYNHEDVATYDLKDVSPIGRRHVQKWLDGTVENNYVGQAFWDAHSGQPPFAALHVCDNNNLCGDRAVIISPDDVPNIFSQACSKSCPTLQSFYDSSISANSLCLNPCHKNCWAPTSLTAILIRDPAVYPEKYPYIFGNSNLKAMSADFISQGGWLDNKMKLDWTELYDLQQVWCGQASVNEEQEPYKMGYGPKFGPLIDGRNDATGEVIF